jgi:hypothetical protein
MIRTERRPGKTHPRTAEERKMGCLQDKVAIVAGAGTGMGRAIPIVMAAEGHTNVARD